MNLLQFRLDWLKKILNATIRKLSGTIPEVHKHNKVTKLTEEIFQQMLTDAAQQPAHHYRDRNFPRLIDTTRKILNFITETDNHYEGQLAQFYILVMLKTSRLYEAWQLNRPNEKFEDFVEWFSGTAFKSIEKIQTKPKKS